MKTLNFVQSSTNSKTWLKLRTSIIIKTRELLSALRSIHVIQLKEKLVQAHQKLQSFLSNSTWHFLLSLIVLIIQSSKLKEMSHIGLLCSFTHSFNWATNIIVTITTLSELIMVPTKKNGLFLLLLFRHFNLLIYQKDQFGLVICGKRPQLGVMMEVKHGLRMMWNTKCSAHSSSYQETLWHIPQIHTLFINFFLTLEVSFKPLFLVFSSWLARQLMTTTSWPSSFVHNTICQLIISKKEKRTESMDQPVIKTPKQQSWELMMSSP